MFKIYRVSLPNSTRLGYDSYSEFVAIAESEEKVRMMHPNSGTYNPKFDYEWGNTWIKFEQTDTLIVEEIGVANKNYQKEVILTASFHAG